MGNKPRVWWPGFQLNFGLLAENAARLGATTTLWGWQQRARGRKPKLLLGATRRINGNNGCRLWVLGGGRGGNVG
eukprot:9849843-Lingulodinium_polyedra.AAC.1